MQGFAGTLLANEATKGVSVAIKRFTAQAAPAALTSGHWITLIDEPKLAHLMAEYDVDVRTVPTVRVQQVALRMASWIEA